MAVRSLNKVMLIGNLTRDPETRFTANNNAVCSFGLATNRTWMPREGGEKQEQVEYHNVVAWGKLAEICGQYLHKGHKLYVEGRLQTREWKTNDGQDRRTTEVIMENMIMLSGKGEGAEYSSGGFDGGSASFSGSKASASPASGGGVTKKKGKSKAASEDVTPPSDAVEDAEDISDDIPF